MYRIAEDFSQPCTVPLKMRELLIAYTALITVQIINFVLWYLFFSSEYLRWLLESITRWSLWKFTFRSGSIYCSCSTWKLNRDIYRRARKYSRQKCCCNNKCSMLCRIEMNQLCYRTWNLIYKENSTILHKSSILSKLISHIHNFGMFYVRF